MKKQEHLKLSRTIRIMLLTMSLSMGLLGNRVNLFPCFSNNLTFKQPELQEEYLTLWLLNETVKVKQ